MINCYEIYNSRCIKCHKTHFKMMHVGALAMCKTCFSEEFGKATNIRPESEDGDKYYKWLEKLKKEVGMNDLMREEGH